MSDPAVEHYLSQYRDLQPYGGGTWLGRQRDSALDVLKQTGFPTRRVEEWRYTDIKPILRRNFSFVSPAAPSAAGEVLEQARVAGLDCHELVFLNGTCRTEQADLSALPAGVQVKSLAAALRDGDPWVEEYLNTRITPGKNAFVALNIAFLRDGAAIHVPDDVVLDKPINLIFLGSTGACNPRNLVVLGRHARADLIETYYGHDEQEYFTNAVTEINLAEGASLQHYRLQQEGQKAYHIGSVHVRQDGNSEFESHQVSLGGGLSRSELEVKLTGEGSGCLVNGLYMGGDKQHLDHHTRVDHLTPRTRCSETFRGVLADRARGVFNGRIIVHKGAQKTDAHLSNANLLLSGDAEVDTKPELEIYADDVKCSHGATVGRLDDQMLFYLRTRAINEEVARSLLTFAFAEDVITRIRHPEIRNRLERIIVGRLPDAALIREFVK